MLADAEPQEMRFVIDDQEVEIPLLLAEIMNTGSAGPRLSLAPAARPGDGLPTSCTSKPRPAQPCCPGSRRPQRGRRR
jgi:diacylglycerol kinase family enzyme